MQSGEFAPGERERAEKFLRLDEDQLYSLIPTYLDEYRETSFSPSGQREAGMTWFAAVRLSLEHKVCEEWQMCKRINDPNFQDVTNLVLVIGDAVTTVIAGVPPFLVASIIVRIGVRNFCSCSS